MAKAATWEHVWWITNNPYEAEHMRRSRVELPAARHLMIRPVGFALLNVPPRTGKQKRFVIVSKHKGDRSCLIPELKKKGLLKVADVAGKHYGGPKGLATYDAVIHVPYQVSIMGMYETLAAGGVYMLPSAKFVRRMPKMCTGSLIPRWVLEPNNIGLMEWYHTDFKEAFVYFDSWGHLASILTDPKTADLLKAKREMGRRIMARIREQSLASWRLLMQNVTSHICRRRAMSSAEVVAASVS
ncbi:hypothetical protein GPECTOR_27g625 [Gonium pectorale]|uniref:Exostosin GT47 domain-containing protein n=1 Tax=Gonium pectorale TaxID=33097 RepID=A0A150GFT5_GONPE|nr:hypothetical protein GPECTOR_27g625 [Gonium pectorale]|eukprot:KXZ48455.1 hypothetical protein GPECTOR_27g625 [Gonium pectorale]